jgi:hypothetical protein
VGALRFAPAEPALLALLDRAEPPVYVAAARALAQLGVARAVPVYAALALAPPRPFRFGLLPPAPRLPDVPGFPLAPLALASLWLHRTGSDRQERALATAGFCSPGVMSWWNGPSPAERSSFTECLAAAGEGPLLAAVAALARGDVAAVARFRDPRLFEALALAMLHRPWSPRGGGSAAAGLAGLESLGEPRCLAFLSCLAGPAMLSWTDASLRERCRTAADRIRERLVDTGREGVPSSPPPGSGWEVVPSRQATGVEGQPS